MQLATEQPTTMLQPGWALILLQKPAEMTVSIAFSGPATEVYTKFLELQKEHGDHVWISTNQHCFDQDGLPIAIGQELLYNEDLVQVCSFSPEGVEVRQPGEPSELVAAFDLHRIKD